MARVMRPATSRSHTPLKCVNPAIPHILFSDSLRTFSLSNRRRARFSLPTPACGRNLLFPSLFHLTHPPPSQPPPPLWTIIRAMPTETVCAKCGGTGWIIVERANVSGAEACTCRNEGRASRLEGRAQIPPLYRNASFENFIVPGPENPMARRELTNVLLAVTNFVREFPNGKRPGLLLVGDPGTGKTHLAVAALRKIMEKGFECLFWNYKDLLDRIRAGFDPTSASSNREAYRAALDAEVLLLDDLGAHRVLEWVEDTMTSIITYRCDNR